MRLIVFCLLLQLPVLAQSEERPLPLRRVTLYQHGVGYFERQGKVTGDQEVGFTFDAAQLNDVLKSLVVLDLQRGRITSVSYDSTKPLDRRLEEFGLKLDATGGASLTTLLGQLKGARVDVRAGAAALTGVIVGIEKRIRSQGGEKTETPELVLMSEGGELRSIVFDQIRSFKLLDAGLREDLERYLGILQSTHRKNARRLAIRTAGEGERDLFLSYVVETPIWKTTYRIVLDAKAKPFLQGWAVVDNVQDEDWSDVTLALVSGAPVSFIQDLQSPLYRERPVVEIPEELSITPQIPQPALAMGTGSGSGVGGMGRAGGGWSGGGGGFGPGAGSIAGTVSDSTGAVIPGATVRIRNLNTGQELVAVTNSAGGYSLGGLASGNYQVQIDQPGFKSYRINGVRVAPNQTAQNRVMLEVGGFNETVTVTADSMVLHSEVGRVMREDGGVEADVETQEVGELFEYRIAHPVTIRRNSSALLPILQNTIDGESVALYNRGVQEGHPMSAVYLHNTTGLTLEGGPLTVVESDTYAGEALMGRIKPGEKRFVTYAVDLGCRVSVREKAGEDRPFLAEITNGEFRLRYKESRTTTYLLTNVTPRAKTVYIEHPYDRSEKWELVRTQAPVETTENFRRFKVTVGPNAGASLTVTEELPEVETYAVNNITSDQMQVFVGKGYLSAQMRQALEAVLELKSGIAALNRQVQERQSAMQAIGQDQARVRENLKVLGKSDEEKQLLQRYVSRLAAGEDQLERLKAEERELQAERFERMRRLDAQLRQLALQHRLRQ
ncbi:MAG: carboxypeptidase regulatory-like domain-containing protein [Blastocatellales bacterium]|nr:carboxypeptidase regulatory-like domain-containing protein [Blastocatellales bacterium]